MKSVIYIAVTLLSLYGSPATAADNYTNALLNEAVRKGNKSTPLIVNPTLTMERLSTSDGEITYHYRSMTLTQNKGVNQFVEEQQKKLYPYVCTSPSQEIFRRHGITVNYLYNDKTTLQRVTRLVENVLAARFYLTHKKNPQQCAGFSYLAG